MARKDQLDLNLDEDNDDGASRCFGPRRLSGLEPILDASFQDDNYDDIHSDYQWFTESGFETDGAAATSTGFLPTPISLFGNPTSSDGRRRHCYDVDDATLAQIDIEDFHSQDILLRLPPMCGSDLQPNEGETIASITGSILQQLEFDDSSMSPNTRSEEDDENVQMSMDMSICKSENLFSPIVETTTDQLPLSTFSTDSLDARAGEILANCQRANRYNYTIAFQGGADMDESTTTSSTYRTAPMDDPGCATGAVSPDEMTEADIIMTNWKQLNNCPVTTGQTTQPKTYDNKGSDNNNGSSDGSAAATSSTMLTQSCPGNGPWIYKGSSNARNLVKVFDVQNVTQVQLAQMFAKNRVANMRDSMTDGSSLSSGSAGEGRHNINFLMEESWNNNRHPTPNNLTRSRRYRKPSTITQMADAIRKSRDIQIQTSCIQTMTNTGRNQYRMAEGSQDSKNDKPPPVYICYPNYTLPDLRFLEDRRSKNDVFLMPQQYKVPMRPRTTIGSIGMTSRSNARRPMSCNDIEELRNRDLSYVKDWPSLNFLLPQEYQTILQEIKPIEQRERGDEDEKDVADIPEECNDNGAGAGNNDVVLRRTKNRHNPTKRYSCLIEGNRRHQLTDQFKRFSLQETLPEVAEITTEIAKNLEQLETLTSLNLTSSERSNATIESMSSCPFSSASSQNNNSGHRRAPANTPKQTSFADSFDNHFRAQLGEMGEKMIAHVAPMCSVTSRHARTPVDLTEKQSLTDAVASAVTQIQVGTDNRASSGSSGSSGAGHQALNQIIMSQTPMGRVVLDTLCPALYSLLSDGLCPFLETIFGRVPNTVWRVVEASIQYGPTAQTLNELVLRINSEELLAEGPMKFNAFVCGLLNLRNLGSWLTFLRTKERLLRTHYDPEAFMFLCNTSTRFLYDQMLVNMHLLAKPPLFFQLDIFHETKLLHQSINSATTPTKSTASVPGSRKNSSKVGSSTADRRSGNSSASSSTGRKSSSADTRPASKVQSKNSKYHANQLKKSQMKRSFSDERPKTRPMLATAAAFPKSKTAQNIQNERQLSTKPTVMPRLRTKLPSQDDIGREKGMSEPTKAQRPKSFEGTPTHYGDSSKDTDRFRRLQMQWELLSSDETTRSNSKVTSPVGSTNPASLIGSKIPRPITSPTRANYPGQIGYGNVRPSSAFSKR